MFGKLPRESSFLMHEVRTEVEIEATPERLWSILLDFPSYPEWNPFVRRVKGVAKVGDRLTAFIQPQGGRGMTFRPTVLTVTPNQELRWRGRVLLPGIFDGEHYFQISPLAPGRLRFIQGERFSGILASRFREIGPRWWDQGGFSGDESGIEGSCRRRRQSLTVRFHFLRWQHFTAQLAAAGARAETAAPHWQGAVGNVHAGVFCEAQ